MTLEEKCSLSYYKTISVLSKPHHVFLVQHMESGRIFVKKELTVYDASVYRYLKSHPVPGLPQIYEVVEDEGKLLVIEEYINGISLEELLKEGKHFSEITALRLTRQLLSILKTLHCQKPPILHRDIKPSNLILSPDGKLKLLDMNAAKWYTQKQSQDTRLIGTFGYAAPEQYGFGTSSPQTDLYAVGILLNELLTGALPNEKKADGPVAKVIEKSTQLNPKDRYVSAAEMYRVLHHLEKNLSSRAPFIPDPLRPRDFLPPGLSSQQAFTVIFSLFGYALLIYLSVTLQYTSREVSPLFLRIFRIMGFLSFFSVILFSGNYLHVQERLGINRIPWLPVRILVVLLADILLFCVIILFFAVLIYLLQIE